MPKETYTNILIPKGEWLSALLTAFRVAGLELEAPYRGYEYTFVTQSLPIICQAVRSKEVLTDISDEDCTANAGLTGSDITQEQNWEGFQEPFPLRELKPSDEQFPEPKLYLGLTPNLSIATRKPSPQESDLSGLDDTYSIMTAYPVITQRFLEQAGLTLGVVASAGTIEGRWRTRPNNVAILDISSTGDTARANEIQIARTILTPELVWVLGNSISKQDKLRVNDLQEKVYLALQGN